MAPRLISSGVADLIPMKRGGQPHRHVSYIIRKLCLRLGHFEDTGSPDFTRMELGSAFEDALAAALAERWSRAYPDRFVRTGELELDSMFGNPDLLDVVDWAIVEIKLTWMTSNQDPEGEKFWKYWTQGKAYAKMAGTRKVRLHVCHINGNYRDNRSPIYNIWEDEFSQRDIDNNWKMIVTHADQEEAQIGSDKTRKQGRE